MINFKKKYIKIKNKIFLKSLVGNIQIFYVDKIIKVSKNIIIKKENNNIYFEGTLGKISLIFTNKILFFIKNKKIILVTNINKKKKKYFKFIY